MLKKLYQQVILKYPMAVFSLLIIGILAFGYYTTKLEIDASSETLLLENDPDLNFSRAMNERFKTENFLVITYRPTVPMLSEESLSTIENIRRELEKLPLVKSIDSILTVPLLLSPPKEIKELVDDVKTLENSTPDKALVQNEFLSNPLYKGNIVSKDFKTSAIVVNLYKDSKYYELLNKKNSLQKLKNRSSLEENELKTTIEAFKKHRDKRRAIEHENIEEIRNIMKNYQSKASLFLGGVNMIANDIVGFVKNDLVIYGSTLVLILIFILWVVFRCMVWIVLPILISTLSIIAITSSLGFFGWEITVISSNFIALQLIITLSIVLHLIVRYNELLRLYPKASNHRIILLTVLSKATPTFFAIITTIAGFSSLIISNIKPVINLGWMMSAGIALSLIIAFIVFPTVMVKLPKLKIKINKQSSKTLTMLQKFSFTQSMANIVKNDKKAILITTGFIILFSLSGASMLIVENSFINYFKQNTEIYKGMKVIDEDLGGTTPLDIVLTFKEMPQTETTSSDESDGFEEEFAESENEEQYWFTKEKMDKILEIHNYLENISEIGNVQSLAGILKIGKILNQDKALDGFNLALLYNNLPEKYKKIILSPYISIEHNQVRFSTRIIDSNEALRRDILLKEIQQDLNSMIDPKIAEFKLSNLMVLYNNMLQSLFDSQIATLGFVLIIITIMFLLLFRSLSIALIAITVNIIPIGIIFGFMGWFNIPLDIMTITIAAIAVGIGVDDTIHYIHRFKKEYAHEEEYMKSVELSDNSIGHAMQYTSVTIMLGFSILVLSNLIPTIYFGLLTMLVMGTALLADMVLLPKLLVLFKPFKK
ncbi:MMPL family transporter [bacterium]|nr:MMPL family transporter [bacterium]MBU1957860.1 MMPL family transporter [bacterium]